MLIVTCAKCKSEVSHVCNANLREAITRLYEFQPEWHWNLKNILENQEGYSKGDENAPFFSEAVLYPLLGKEDARTVLALIGNIIRATGLDPSEF
jgi:hypothetical protein